MIGNRRLFANINGDDIFRLGVFQACGYGFEEFLGRLAGSRSRVLGSRLLLGARLGFVRQGLSSFRKRAAATVLVRLPVGDANCSKVTEIRSGSSSLQLATLMIPRSL